MADLRITKLARVLTRYSLALKPGDVLSINGSAIAVDDEPFVLRYAAINAGDEKRNRLETFLAEVDLARTEPRAPFDASFWTVSFAAAAVYLARREAVAEKAKQTAEGGKAP